MINYHEDGTWEKIWYDDENHEVKRENMHGEEYYVDFNSNTTGKPYILIGEKNYSLYTMDGKIRRVNGGGHGMIVVGYTDDGRPIVSSWGGKYYLERSTNQDDIDFSNKYNRIFYFGK